MKQEHLILHVEDNPDDVMLMGMAFRRAGAAVRLEPALDGDKAIAALQSMSASAPPSCVLLDIKLPTLSGLEVLAWIRKHERLQSLPVIMLTSSALPADIQEAYRLGANSYLVKPPDLDSLVNLARMIDAYWLGMNQGPALDAESPPRRLERPLQPTAI